MDLVNLCKYQTGKLERLPLRILCYFVVTTCTGFACDIMFLFNHLTHTSWSLCVQILHYRCCLHHTPPHCMTTNSVLLGQHMALTTDHLCVYNVLYAVSWLLSTFRAYVCCKLGTSLLPHLCSTSPGAVTAMFIDCRPVPLCVGTVLLVVAMFISDYCTYVMCRLGAGLLGLQGLQEGDRMGVRYSQELCPALCLVFEICSTCASIYLFPTQYSEAVLTYIIYRHTAEVVWCGCTSSTSIVYSVKGSHYPGVVPAILLCERCLMLWSLSTTRCLVHLPFNWLSWWS